jgi:hypothetical protein
MQNRMKGYLTILYELKLPNKGDIARLCSSSLTTPSARKLDLPSTGGTFGNTEPAYFSGTEAFASSNGLQL